MPFFIDSKHFVLENLPKVLPFGIMSARENTESERTPQQGAGVAGAAVRHAGAFYRALGSLF